MQSGPQTHGKKGAGTAVCHPAKHSRACRCEHETSWTGVKVEMASEEGVASINLCLVLRLMREVKDANLWPPHRTHNNCGVPSY
jgi:hypothetical protein